MRNTVKLLALNASPHRRGNTATIMGWIAEGAQQAGAAIDWLHLADLNINYCQGCQACLSDQPRCQLVDDLPQVLQGLQDAHGVIVGSPVYGGSVSAQLKTLLDRITLLKLYAALPGERPVVGVATSGIAPATGVARQASALFGRAVGNLGVKCARITQGDRSPESLQAHPKRRKALRLGRKLVRRCRSGKPGVSLRHIWINFLRRMILKHQDQFAAILPRWKENGWL